MNHIHEFSDALAAHGLYPKNISYGKEVRRFVVNGKRKNGWYWLDSAGDISFGAYGDWQSGLNKKWFSKNKENFSHEERRTLDKKVKENDRLTVEKNKAAAHRAVEIWKSAPWCIAHPYAVTKEIILKGVKEKGGRLIIPLYFEKELVNLQFITPKGVKLFLKGGRFKGAYSIIRGEDWSSIIICEGYATGASITEATGYPSIIAFNNSNLIIVAKTVRENYPTAKIIIAADNDKNISGNPGLTCAKRAATAVGGKVVYPEFVENDLTDFNDLHRIQGLKAVRRIISPPDMTTIDQSDWRAFLIPGKHQREDYPFPYDNKSDLNAYLFLRNMHNIFCRNEFSDQIMIMHCPPWENETDFMPRPVRDSDLFMTAGQLERYGLKVGKNGAYDAILKLSEENIINPPRDYFDNLKWDKQLRLDNWLTYFMGAYEQPREYLALVGAKWLIGAVSRIYKPGCKFDSVLIFEGGQGIGKSNALRMLATFNGQDYFMDSVGDIRNKDTLMTMQGKIIIEMAELASLRKVDNEEIKGFVSRQVDEYRPPYGRIAIKRPRYFVLSGTTNEMHDGYLADITGNRRYWPVKCGNIDLDGLEEEKEQLWAEAVHRYKQGERSWLDDEQVLFSTAEQEKRIIIDAWHDKIANIVYGEMFVTTDFVFEKLGITAKDMNRISRTRIKGCLVVLGWYETQKDGKRIWKKK